MTPVLLAASLLLSACGMGGPYEAPGMRLPDRYSMVMPIRGATADPRWWLAFDDPVLARLVDEGLSGSLSVAEARSRVAEAEALARRAGLSVTGDARLEANREVGGSDTRQTGLSLVLEPPGGRIARLGGARARLDAARLGEAEVRRILLSELATAYVDLRFTQQLLVFRRADLGSRRLTLREVTTQVEAGVATRLDQVRARALVVETEGQIPQVESGIVAQRNRISTLLGRTVGDLPVSLEFTGRQPQPRAAAVAGVPADLLRARPDIVQAERLYAAAISDIGAARADRFPRLSLSGLIETPFGGGGSNESLAAGITIPVFSQPALAAEVSAAEARAGQALLQWRAAVLAAVEEVENALAALHGSQRAARSAREVVALNEESLDLSRQLLESRGDATVLDVIDRERAVADSRVVLAQTMRDVAQDHITLRTALGLDDGLGGAGAASAAGAGAGGAAPAVTPKG